MSDDTFYDIHMHAFNLIHPYFRAFINRFRIGFILMPLAGIISILTLVPGLNWIIGRIANQTIRRLKNLLAVFDSDIGSFFLMMEDCLREKPNQLL
jgi:hypothetical protein